MTNYKIVVASGNPGKIKEIKKIFENLKDLKIDIESLDNHLVEEPEEPHDNFMDNAIHKAKHYAKYTNEATFSEDSGLCIEALDNFPGVRTKEFIKESGSAQAAFVKIEQMLSGHSNYKASFSTACALYIPINNTLIVNEVKIYGAISFPPRGETGFGFDPIFIPDGYNQTFAELGMEIKNQLSPRSKATKKIAQILAAILQAKPLE